MTVYKRQLSLGHAVEQQSQQQSSAIKSQKPLTTVSGDDCSRVHCQGKDTGRLSFAHVTGTAKLLARSKTDACTGEASARCFKLWTLPLHFANQLAYAA